MSKSKTTKPKIATAPKAATVEGRLTALEARVNILEERQLRLPSEEDFEATKMKLTTWAQQNPLAALGVAVLVGFIVGLILF